MSGTFGGCAGLRRARFASLVAAVALAAFGFALGGCANAPAPPPETTAETQVQLEEAHRDLERIEANKARTDAYWAKLWGDGVAEIRKRDLQIAAAQLVEKAKAEDRAVTTEEVQALVNATLATREADAAEIAATIEAAKDPNLEVAKERINLALDYVTEITERERRVARLRAQIGLKPVAAPALPKGKTP